MHIAQLAPTVRRTRVVSKGLGGIEPFHTPVSSDIDHPRHQRLSCCWWSLVVSVETRPENKDR